jgi:uncharacterized membrane protein
MSFTNPDAFLLLLIIPIFIFLGWPRHTFRRRRDLISLSIRITLIIVLILSLAGLQIQRESDNLAVVFLVDVSDSMDEDSQAQALAYVRNAIDTMEETDQAAVVLFGDDAQVEAPMQQLISLQQEPGTDPIAINTDMAEAIRLGLALFPPDAAKRLVVLSDGLETTGDATRAAELAAATGVQIDYVPFGIVRDREVLINSVRVPSVVGEDEPFDLVVAVENKGESTVPADLTIEADGEAIYDAEVSLTPGVNRFNFGPLQYPRSRFVDFRVIVEPQTAEGFGENNALSAFTQVSGRPRILIVANDAAETAALEDALTDAGFEMDVMQPDEVPIGLPPLINYQSIILANVPAADLTPARMEVLQQYVRDVGRGLVVIGGPDSYGVGGYFETPLEETLPVEMRIRDEERIPQLTMVYVVDRSGSMDAVGPSGFSNMELAKEAMLRSLNFLNDYDRTGVISFREEASWEVELQEIGDNVNRQNIEDIVASLRSGGGTDIFGGMAAIDRELPGDPSTLKHVILLTDGGANREGVVPLTARLNTNHDITTSVIAMGQDYAPWLREVAAEGGGNFHVTSTVESIPAIFSAETVLATRSYIVEEPFRPALTASSPIIDGIALSGIPALQGYIATTPKDTATVVLTGPDDDPILAQWQYGLGRAVAFTSDATLRWGTDWVTNWADYTRFWNQAVRWTITENADSNVDVRVEARGDQQVIIVDARDTDGNYLNQLNLNSTVIYPDNETQEPGFRQVAPGRYEAAFTPNQEGAYIISVNGATEEGAPVPAAISQSTGWVLSYSREYSVSEPDARFLEEISGITGGASLAGNPAGAFLHNLNQEDAALPLYPYLLALAAVLLILDIAVRRLVINKSDMQRLREYAAGLVGRGPSTYEDTQTKQRIGDLMRAKQRVSGSDEQAEATTTAPAAPTATTTQSDNKADRKARRQKKTQPRQADKKTPAASQTASALLKKKRERDD